VNQVQGPPTELIYQAPVAQTLTATVLTQLEAVSKTGPVVAALQPATRSLQPSADNDEEPPELWDGNSDRGDRDDDLPDLLCENNNEYGDEEPADEQPVGPGDEPPDPNAPPDGDAVTPAEAAAVCRRLQFDPPGTTPADPRTPVSDHTPATPSTPAQLPEIRRAVLLHTLAEARRFLRYCLDHDLLPRSRIAMLTQLYNEAFEVHEYEEVLHPLDDWAEPMLHVAGRRIKGFNVIDLTAKETALFAESMRATEEMPDVNSVELPDAAQNVTIAATEE
jgi:hypothetical protein